MKKETLKMVLPEEWRKHILLSVASIVIGWVGFTYLIPLQLYMKIIFVFLALAPWAILWIIPYVVVCENGAQQVKLGKVQKEFTWDELKYVTAFTMNPINRGVNASGENMAQKRNIICCSTEYIEEEILVNGRRDYFYENETTLIFGLNRKNYMTFRRYYQGEIANIEDYEVLLEK